MLEQTQNSRQISFSFSPEWRYRFCLQVGEEGPVFCLFVCFFLYTLNENWIKHKVHAALLSIITSLGIVYVCVVPEEFMYNPVSRSYGEPHKRPEVQNATIEFIAPSEYMVGFSCVTGMDPVDPGWILWPCVFINLEWSCWYLPLFSQLRPPQPAVYLFVLDVSYNAVETGYLNVFCQLLLDNINSCVQRYVSSY